MMSSRLHAHRCSSVPRCPSGPRRPGEVRYLRRSLPFWAPFENWLEVPNSGDTLPGPEIVDWARPGGICVGD